MTEEQVHDVYLLALADLFEKGRPNVVLDWRLTAKSVGIPEDVASRVVAKLKGEQAIAGEYSDITFTSSGYQRYLPRIQALRKLGGKP